MSSLKNISDSQLNKMLAETKAEMNRRENIDRAHKEIRAICKKYNVTIADLEFGLTRKIAKPNKNSQKKSFSSKSKFKKHTGSVEHKNDRRGFVAPKYRKPASNETWSGRGRAPMWVTEICKAENIDIEQFKADSRFCI